MVTVDGDQEPAMPLFEMFVNVPAVAFWQYGPSCVKRGVVSGFTVTVVELVVLQPVDALVAVTL